MRQRILTTRISVDDGTRDLHLVLEVAEYFGLAASSAKTIVKKVAALTASRRDVAASRGVRPAEIRRMASAFEHDDLKRALEL